MTSFTTRTAGLSDLPPDPTKHVNFSFGMVLGVDDLKQEFAYLSGRDQWLARDLLGYGTAVGLGVTTDYEGEAGGIVEVVVTPGTALGPRGQLIRVNATQCAEVNGWLARAENRARADTLLGNAASGTLALYVVLSYRACATDDVPIPGEPCRSEEESMAASRLADNYRLELTFQAPDQREEQALRDFVRWLEQVRITREPGGDGFVSLKNFEQAVRGAMQGGSPPVSMRVETANACQYLRAAFRIWATELRPSRLGAGASPGAPPTEEGVLLAELSVPVIRAAGGGWAVAARASRQIEVSEESRPYLLHLRMVQEWIECGRRVRAPGDSVMTEVSFGQTAAPGVAESYSRSDHTHGTPPLTGDVVARGTDTRVERIYGAPITPRTVNTPFNNGDVLIFANGKWVPQTPPAGSGTTSTVPELGGDITGPIQNNTLNRIKGFPVFSRQGDEVSNVLPGAPVYADGDFLIFRGGKWVPERLAGGGPIDTSIGASGQPYAVVAAGIVMEGSSRGPVYSDLNLRVVGAGIVTVGFTGYRPPDETFQYIVKALPVFNAELKTGGVVIMFDSFLRSNDLGFRLRVMNNGAPMEAEPLRLLELMIEVSRYETAPKTEEK